MALIGEMQYLTIGGDTYSIPTSGGSTVSITRSLTTGTKSATITVDGTPYDIYSTNNSGGTVTSVRVQATSPVQSSVSTASSTTLNTTISLASGYGDTQNPYASKTKNYVLAAPATEAGAPSFRALVAADIPDLSGTYLTSHQSIKTLHSKTLTGTGDVTLTYSDVGAAASSHTHGNITSGGDITATAPTIASGDQIIINDHSASKITNGPTFDGSTTTTALTPKGTWETFLKSYTEQYTGTITKVTTTAGAHTAVDVSSGAVSFNVPTATSHLTNDSGFVTTDNKVLQNSSTSNIAQPILFRNNVASGASNSTDSVRYVNTVTIAPSTGNIAATTFNGYTLADACAKGVTDNSSSTAVTSTDTNLITARTLYYAGYTKNAGTITGVTAGTGMSGGGTSGSVTLNHSNSVTAQTTQAVYPIKIDAQGHISAYGSAVTVPTTYVSTVTTTAGAHTAISSKSGTVSFNVPTKTSHLTNDSGFVTTDSKLAIAQVSDTSTYYPIFGSGTSAATRQYDTNFRYGSGSSEVVLSIGFSSGKNGSLSIYKGSYYINLTPNTLSANRSITLPDKAGTIALTSDIPTVPTISLNGSSTTSASFYAPTSAGTSGYFLKSNGSGAPTWAAVSTTAAQIVRWS